MQGKLKNVGTAAPGYPGALAGLFAARNASNTRQRFAEFACHLLRRGQRQQDRSSRRLRHHQVEWSVARISRLTKICSKEDDLFFPIGVAAFPAGAGVWVWPVHVCYHAVGPLESLNILFENGTRCILARL